MLEDSGGDTPAVEHEIFADDAAGIGETVGELLVGGEEKQARSFGAVGADDYSFGFLQVSVALFVEVGGAGDAAVVVHLNAMDVGVGADLAAAGFLGDGNGGGEGAGLGADFAAEGEAEATIDAGAAAGTG